MENIYCTLQYEYMYAVKREKRIWVLVVFDGEGLVSTNEAFVERNKSKCLHRTGCEEINNKIF
jgi:hypothetical protein